MQIMKKLFFSLVLGAIIAICWVMIIHTLKWIAIRGNEFEILNQQQQAAALLGPQQHQHRSSPVLQAEHLLQSAAAAGFAMSAGESLLLKTPSAGHVLGDSPVYAETRRDSQPVLAAYQDATDLNGGTSGDGDDDSSTSSEHEQPAPQVAAASVVTGSRPKPSVQQQQQPRRGALCT